VHYPDPTERDCILNGLRKGFDINVSASDSLARLKVRNLPTIDEQKLRISEWILKNHSKGALWGPFERSALPPSLRNLRVSPIGAVRKGTHYCFSWKTREWRPIHHLSHPRKGSLPYKEQNRTYFAQ